MAKDTGPEKIVCATCGAKTRAEEVSISLWTNKGLVVVEAIPARVCGNCDEQFYGKETQDRILALSGNGFPDRMKVREITVPVYSLHEPEGGNKTSEGNPDSQRSGT